MSLLRRMPIVPDKHIPEVWSMTKKYWRDVEQVIPGCYDSFGEWIPTHRAVVGKEFIEESLGQFII